MNWLAKIRMSGVFAKIFKILMIVIIIPVVMVGSVYFMNKQGVFNLQSVQVAIDGFESHPHYFSPLSAKLNQRLQQYKNQSLWKLDLNSISKQVFQEDWIASARISRQWPSNLQVNVVPKKIKLLMADGAANFLPVDESGSLLRPVKSSQAPRLPILKSSAFMKDVSIRKQAVDFVSQLPIEGKFSQQSLSEIYYDSKKGFWTTLIDQNIQVNLGKENLPIRSARVSQVLEYMDNREMQARVIDADLSKKVLVRLRKDP